MFGNLEIMENPFKSIICNQKITLIWLEEEKANDELFFDGSLLIFECLLVSKSLKELTIRNYRLTNRQLKKVEEIILKISSIKKFSFNLKNEEIPTHFLDVLCKNQSIMILDLHNQIYNFKSLKSLISLMKNNKFIVSLNLSESKIDEWKELEDCIMKNNSLEFLDLGNMKIPEEVCSKLSNTKLKRLILSKSGLSLTALKSIKRSINKNNGIIEPIEEESKEIT